MLDISQALENIYDEVDYEEFYEDLFPAGSFEEKGIYEKTITNIFNPNIDYKHRVL